MCRAGLTQPDLRHELISYPERIYCDWVPLPGLEGVTVTAQPLRLDGADGPIFPADALTADLCATLLDAVPTTAAIEDAIWTHADAKMTPKTFKNNNGTWAQALEWWACAEDWLRQQRVGPTSLVSFGDKSWVLYDRCPSGRVANYGLHVPADECDHRWLWRGCPTSPTVSATNARVIQMLACAHDARHADYSQHVRLWRGPVRYAGTRLRLA